MVLGRENENQDIEIFCFWLCGVRVNVNICNTIVRQYFKYDCEVTAITTTTTERCESTLSLPVYLIIFKTRSVARPTIFITLHLKRFNVCDIKISQKAMQWIFE